ncbi:hypothetical protein CASFOL_023345 [Castilleja foliolosa]|uniref:C3H1-type domain-containing protein n=1 Tax=Castilleja foliolosa TaxID=1961234 RepID=A0ABD3CM30_9LAMI
MQTENISLDGLTSANAHFSKRNPFLSPTSPENYVSSSDAHLYSSLFQNYSPKSISDAASFDGGDADRRFHDSSCVLEYQQLYNRYTLCVGQLRDTIEEVEALRRQNDSLRLSNADLNHRVALLFSRDRLLSEFNRFNIASPSPAAAPPPVRVAAPQPVNTERVALPKSISVRSKGFLKMTRPSRDTTRQKSQRMYVPGAIKEEEALELDVYNQGMLKTELCNKWQETGACPYGDNCQFAHGIKELRPVIRHPRYKTEVCRLVLAGDICPYGHRCHFRHALTQQERLMVTKARPAPPSSR